MLFREGCDSINQYLSVSILSPVGSSLCLKSVCPSLPSPGSALDCAGGQRTRGQQPRVETEAGVSVARTAIGGSGQWSSGERGSLCVN